MQMPSTTTNIMITSIMTMNTMTTMTMITMSIRTTHDHERAHEHTLATTTMLTRAKRQP